MNILKILLEKASKQELGHFYIIETSSTSTEAQTDLIDFIGRFIREYYQKIEGHKQELIHLIDHPDVFILGNTSFDEEANDKFFKVEEAESLNRFFEFKAVQSKRKFAIITEAHRVNSTVANKLLKLLEEPTGNSTIFLLNPRRVQLLATIHSRAIHLRLPAKGSTHDFSQWSDFLKDVKSLGLAPFLETYSKKESDLSFWVNELICWEAEQNFSAEQKNALQKWLIHFQEMETFHQSTSTKWALFYSYVRENVLPRLN